MQGRSGEQRRQQGLLGQSVVSVNVAVTACDSNSKICSGTTLDLVWQYATCEVIEME